MNDKPVLGIGWDVGGWMGKKQGVAVAQWRPGTGGVQWLGTPTSFKLPAERLITPSDLLGYAGLAVGLLDGHIVVVAIDAPLGFPADFSQFLSGWPFAAGRLSVAAGRPEREIDNRLAYRATDRHIHDTFRVVRDGVVGTAAKKPLSATFDKLGNNGTVAISHVRMWREHHGFVVRPMDESDGGDRHVIEVYPALLKEKRHGLRGQRVQERFQHLLADLDAGVLEGTDAHDAAICAALAVCLAVDGRGGLPKLVGPSGLDGVDLATVKREGWIYYPEPT